MLKKVPPMSLSTRVRCVLAVMCYLAFGIGGSLISVLLLLCFFLPERARVRVGSKVLQYSWKMLCCMMSMTRNLSLRVPDKKKMQRIRGSIVVANHPSLIDVVILTSIIPGSKLVANSKLQRWRFLRPILKGLCITNDMGAEQFMTQAKHALDNGFNVIIFPEGTRTTPGKVSKLQRGAFQLALQSGYPLVPIHIHTDGPFLTKEYPWWYVGEHCPHFTLSLGDPVVAQVQEGETRHAAAVRISRTVADFILPGQDFS